MSGRLRTELYALRNNPDVALHFEQAFSSINGILSIKTNIISGKILLQYDENTISLNEVCTLLSKFEEKLFKEIHGFHEADEDTAEIEEETYAQVAATSTFSSERSYIGRDSRQNIVDSMLSLVPKHKWSRAPADEQVPLPLALSLTGLGVLGIKQLLFGRSLLARHPIPFYLAAALSIGTGYSFLKRRLKKLSLNQRFKFDLLLSASTLALALIRENLVVLAGISLIQYLNWKREKSVGKELMDQEFVSEEIEAYSRKQSKLGFIGAGAAFAVTRNPLVFLGILLAANPRPITISSEYAWKQAEYTAKENKQAIPINGSVYQLAQTKYIVFKDASLLASNGKIRKEVIPILTHFTGGKVAVVNNDLNPTDLCKLEKNLLEYGVKLISHQDISINSREEVLIIVKNKQDRNEQCCFFLSILYDRKTEQHRKNDGNRQRFKEINRPKHDHHKNLECCRIYYCHSDDY